MGNIINAKTFSVNPQSEQIQSKSSGVVSSNSTTTPLLAGQSFIGQWVNCEGYSAITISISQDQPSAIDGAKVQFSTDGTDANALAPRTFTAPALPDGAFFALGCQAKFFRVHYTNGATDQTTFNLQVQLKINETGQAYAPLNIPLTENNTAAITRAVIAGQDADTGIFENVEIKNKRLQVESVTVPQILSRRDTRQALNAGSKEMNVNGSLGSPIVFEVPALPTEDVAIESMTFQAFASGIKIDKFLSINNELSNGILIEIKSGDTIYQSIPIVNTTQFNSLFALGPARSFSLIFASGSDSMVATYGPENPFIIKKQGTYATDDYIRVSIRDDLRSVTRLRFITDGRVIE